MPIRSIQIVVCIDNLLFLLINVTPSCGCTIVYLTTYPLKDFWIISSFGLYTSDMDHVAMNILGCDFWQAREHMWTHFGWIYA